MKTYYKHKNIKYAQANRRVRNMTKEERILWFTTLRNLEVRFIRQYCFGNFILDFYCPTRKIAIELDGEQHFEDGRIFYDNKRTKYLELFGVKVLRFNNLELKRDLRYIQDYIYDVVTKEEDKEG